MNADNRLVYVFNSLAESSDNFAIILNTRVADGIGNIYRCRACVYYSLYHLAEIIKIGAHGVFGGELNIVAEFFREAHAVGGDIQYFRACLAQFTLNVYVGGRYECMYTGFF